MKNDRKNLKETFDLSLENIRVTEELKKSTMEKCAKRNTSWLKYTTISAAALLAVVILINNPFSHPAKPDANIALNKNVDSVNQSPIIQSTAPEIQKSIAPSIPDQAIVQNATVPQQVYTTPQENDNKTFTVNKPVNEPVYIENKPAQPKEVSPSETTPISQDNTNTASLAVSPDRQNPVPDVPDNGTVKSLTIAAPAAPIDDQLQAAKKYLNENLLLPSYVPEGFKLISVYVIDENNKNGSYVELKYSFNEAYFLIFEDKNSTVNLDDYKKITINSLPAYIRVIPAKQYAEIVWVINNIKYSVSGNIPESTLINLANSLK